MYTHKTPFLLKLLYPECLWDVRTKEKEVFLTFDDGPVPGVTEFVLDTLKYYNTKATFFCVGENVVKYPHIFQRIIEEGHQVGNHTYNHLNGWQNNNDFYFDNIRKCKEAMEGLMPGKKFNLFRPPYGKIKKSQLKNISREYKVIMWDLLTGDFDERLSAEECLQAAVRYTKKGTILIFHDSFKAEAKMRKVLPEYLEFCNAQGYSFNTL
jgi:peptidoglycan-N-acetylglucosamine deacetylase